MKFHRFLALGAFFVVATSSPAISQTQKTSPASVDSSGLVLGNPQNAVDDFGAAFKVLQKYRDAHNGQLPKGHADIVMDMLTSFDKYGVRNFVEGRRVFTNPDFVLSHMGITRERAESVLAYQDNGFKRSDGTPIGGETPAGTRDVLMWADLYVYPNNFTLGDGASVHNPVGFYVVLWADGDVTQIPYDLALFTPGEGDYYRPIFPGQVNPRFDTLTYEERYPEATTAGKPTPGPGQQPVADNGGPEALLQLSRRMATPNSDGIGRDKLWQAFDPNYVAFKLADVQSLSNPLGLPTQVKRLSLDELQASGAPAIIALKTTGRLVTLAAMDADRALIIDGGKTLNVERTLIRGEYSGEALVPTAANRRPAIIASDPVRAISLPSLDTEVAQQVTLRNTGNKPITLQLPYPLLGITEAKLSQSTLAPGESATLDLKMKWRPLLKTPTQNVLVSIATNDSAAPNLQLAFLLTPPQT